MTKDLHPELGSGALREALKVGDEVSVLGTVVDEPNVDGLALVKFGPYELDASCSLDKNVIVLPRLALSLSSPPCSDCGRAEKAHPNTVCIKFTRPTPQASSEVRERLTDDEQASLRTLEAWKEQGRMLTYAELLLLRLLAPSRQGAGGK